MIRSLRSVVTVMTLVATGVTANVAMADDTVDPTAASPATTTSDTPAPEATVAHHHHHHDEAAAKDTNHAAAPPPATAAQPVASAPQMVALAASAASIPQAAPTATPLQLRATEDSHPITLAPEPSQSSMWKLAAILGAMGLAAWALKKKQAQKKPADTVKSLEVLRRLSIGVRSELLVVDVDGQRLLIGVTPNTIQTLASLPDSDMHEAAAEIERAPRESHELRESQDTMLSDRMAALMESTRTAKTIPPSTKVTVPPSAKMTVAPKRLSQNNTPAAAARRPSRYPSYSEIPAEEMEGQARGLAKLGQR